MPRKCRLACHTWSTRSPSRRACRVGRRRPRWRAGVRRGRGARRRGRRRGRRRPGRRRPRRRGTSRTGSCSGRRMSRTTMAHSHSVAGDVRQHGQAVPVVAERALRPARRVAREQHPDADEVHDLAGLPDQEVAPARPGEHGQRDQPQHVLRRVDLVGQQERRHDEEHQLRQPRPARRGSASTAIAAQATREQRRRPAR